MKPQQAASIKPIQRCIFEASLLVKQEPAQLFSKNKKIVYEIACPPGALHQGKLNYSRWHAMELPESVSLRGLSDKVLCQAGYYDYLPSPGPSESFEWHLNFADPDLFLAYGSDLLAQDEMQVAEHPVLASLKQKLNALQIDSSTVNDQEPTPVLIKGAERRCSLKTEPNDSEGRPLGLYGNAFHKASEDAIRKAVNIITPPTITNLICIAAPDGGEGSYQLAEIIYALKAAYTGFKAAMIESGTDSVIIHSGYWGCGAYGGNRILMTWLQALAATLAGVDQLILHTGEPDFGELKMAWSSINEKIGVEPLATNVLLEKILAMGFEWNEGDGN
ncbi:MAG: hypothetical protein JST69_01575 [Bacteroidetes bacterium]|nr:hypothetical protein [Bacteroidota bacterium]